MKNITKYHSENRSDVFFSHQFHFHKLYRVFFRYYGETVLILSYYNETVLINHANKRIILL